MEQRGFGRSQTVRRSRGAATTRRPMLDDLVALAQAGDLEAFSALTVGRTDRLFAAALLILRDHDQAADAVQDALLQAWRDLRGLRDVTRFDAWLHRLLVRSCYRAARRGRNRRIVEIK